MFVSSLLFACMFLTTLRNFAVSNDCIQADALTPDAVTPDGRLPNAETGPKGADPSDAQHLRDIFYRMGESCDLNWSP